MKRYAIKDTIAKGKAVSNHSCKAKSTAKQKNQVPQKAIVKEHEKGEASLARVRRTAQGSSVTMLVFHRPLMLYT